MGPSKFCIVSCLGLLLGSAVSAQKHEAVVHQLSTDAPNTPLIQSVDGGALFKAYCATCHGTDAKGSGPMTEWLNVKTPDLTQISARAGGKFPLVRVQRIISGEENLKSGHGTGEMPIWGPIFSQVSGDRDWGRMRVYNLAEFIQTLQRKY